MELFVEIIVGIFTVVLLIIGVALIESIPVYFLWNWLMPELFDLGRLTFLQAVGLSILTSLLFKSNLKNND